MKKYIAISLICFGLTVTAQAATLDETVSHIVANNPAIKAARANATAEASALLPDNNLPDPEIEGEYLFAPSGVENRWGVGISQSFDWPGVYGARKAANGTASKAFELLADVTKAEKCLEIKNLLIDYINQSKNIEVVSQLEATMNRLFEAYSTAYSRGEATLLDINKLKIEKSRLSVMKNRWQTMLTATADALTALNGGEDCYQLLASLDKEYPAVTLRDLDYYLALTDRDPAVASGEAMSSYSDQLVKVARLSAYPGFSLGYAHNYEEGHHFNGLTASISLPFFSGRNKARAAADRALSYTAEATAAAVISRSTTTDAYHKASSLGESLGLVGPVFETTDNLALLKKALDGGEMSLLTYLQEVNYFMEARLDYLDMMYNYQLAVATLTRFE